MLKTAVLFHIVLIENSKYCTDTLNIYINFFIYMLMHSISYVFQLMKLAGPLNKVQLKQSQ